MTPGSSKPGAAFEARQGNRLAPNILFSTAMRPNQGNEIDEGLDRGFFASLSGRMELRNSAKGATDCCCHGDADLPPQNRSELTKDRRNHREVPFVSQTATPAWIEGTQEKMLDSWTTRLNDTFPCRHASSPPCRDVMVRSPFLLSVRKAARFLSTILSLHGYFFPRSNLSGTS